MAKDQRSQSSTDVAVPFFRQRMVVLTGAFLAMLTAAGLAWMMWKWLPEWPVREVKFKGEFKQVNADDLAKVANAIAKTRRSMLRADLDEVQTAVKQVAWVRNADVRRQLPATLEIVIEEHTPYGHWRDVAGTNADVENLSSPSGQTLMVNNFGEVFNVGAAIKTADGKWLEMPVFAGPPGSGRQVLAGFDQFRKQLLTVGRAPKELRLSSRRAWWMKLDNGTTLELGRSDANARLARYISAYKQLSALQATNAHIDLRYQSGLAVRTVLTSKSK